MQLSIFKKKILAVSITKDISVDILIYMLKLLKLKSIEQQQPRPYFPQLYCFSFNSSLNKDIDNIFTWNI